jgi:MSHA biogenesis protein MshG
MPVFAYKGRSARGELVSGRIDGESPDGVAARLFETGVTPIEIVPAKGDGSEDAVTEVGKLLRHIGIGKPKTSDLVLFSRQMYTITKSGIPLLRGFKGLAASTHNVVLREALEDIVQSLEGGRDLSSSFARHGDIFPPLYVNIVGVGESTGTLEASFKRLAEYLTQDQEIQDRVKSAMRYPVIVMVVIGAAMAALTMFVIPRFAPLFRALGDDIPLPTLIIMSVSQFAQNHWQLVFGALIAFFFFANRYVSTERGRYNWHRFKLALPVVGKLVHEGILARISRSLSISLTAGMPMLQTLSIIAKSAGNDFMAEHVTRMREAVERGEPLSRAAASVGMFPPLVLQMMSVGEETGELSDLLDEVAGFYEREVDYALKNLSAAIEPILIVMVGGMVLILALGVFLPMWQMISKVGGGG